MILHFPRLLRRCLAGLIVFLCVSQVARAAISQGPVLTNSTAAEKRRIDDFYRAEQSLQKQRQVGQERYNQKQAARAQVIAAMASQLKAREQSVIVEPAPQSYVAVAVPLEVSRPWLGMAILAALFGGIIYFWNREPASQSARQRAAVALRSKA